MEGLADTSNQCLPFDSESVKDAREPAHCSSLVLELVRVCASAKISGFPNLELGVGQMSHRLWESLPQLPIPPLPVLHAAGPLGWAGGELYLMISSGYLL